MQAVKIYDFDFNLIASDFKCISLDWDVRFNSVGNFEGVFTLDSPIYKACCENEFTICVCGENQGIVTQVRIKDNMIVISGKTMNYILEKKICLPFLSRDFEGEMTETEMVTKLVEHYCGDFMEILPPPVLEKKREFARYEARPLGKIISEILYGVNFGHYVIFDVNSKKWVFGCRPPEYKNLVLSRPDKSLDSCDYVRDTDSFALGGAYKQKAKFMGKWDAEKNNPLLIDGDPDNFAKVYLVSKTGSQFGYTFNEGNYVRCVDLSGKWKHSARYDDFWYKVYAKDDKKSLMWECVLNCSDIEEAYEMLLLKGINENVESITRGANQKNLNLGDVVEIRFISGDNAVVFRKQVKKVRYHFEADNCFVKPTFYKLKENEDEQL